jgi:hypothetical protein
MDLWDGTHVKRSAGTQRHCDRADYDAIVQQMRLAQNGFNGVDSVTLQSIGTKEVIAGLTITEYGDGAVHKTVFTFDSFVLSTTAGSTPAADGAWATDVIYTFPTGTKITYGSGFTFDLLENNPGADGITATSDFDIGVGSVAVAAEAAFSLSSTLSDYGDATVALSGSASTGDSASVTSPAAHTATALNLNLRTVAEADDGGSAAGAVEVTGTFAILWTMIN